MLTIAVCDDNPQFANQLIKRIRELCAYHLPDRIDCRITPAFGSGEDVLRYLQHHVINVMFLDIDMPKINGFRLASEMKSKSPDTIIIFVSLMMILCIAPLNIRPSVSFESRIWRRNYR